MSGVWQRMNNPRRLTNGWKINMFKIIRVTCIVLMFAAVLVGIYGFCFEQWDVFPLTFGIPFAVMALGAWIVEACE